MKECPFKQYCEEDCEVCTDEKKAKLSAITEAMIPLLIEVTRTVKMLAQEVLMYYPNKRIIYLALKHPKKRVRKKNTRRIMRWLGIIEKREKKR